MGIAGMILGILAVVFAIIPIIGWIISIPCLLIGLPLSIIGLLQNRKRGHGYGMAIAGIVTNVVAIVVVILWIFLFVASTEVTDVELGFMAERVPLMPLIYPPGNHIRPGSTFEGEVQLHAANLRPPLGLRLGRVRLLRGGDARRTGGAQHGARAGDHQLQPFGRGRN